jgi:dihydropyrimidinase
VPGKDADLFLFDPDGEPQIKAENNASISDYTIYEGRDIQGSITDTFVRGERIVESGQVTATSPSGQFVSRTVPDWNL